MVDAAQVSRREGTASRWLCPACREPLAVVGETLTCADCDFRLERRGGIVWSAPGFRPAGFGADRRDHLEGLAARHFWFPPRRKLLAGILDRRVRGGPEAAAIDLGCGTGGFLPELTARFGAVTAVDAFGDSLAAAAPLAEGVERIQADVTRVPLAGGRFRLAVALDVLEHVDPDAFLAEAARLVETRGWLLLSVPALPALWSELDAAAGHRCRYTLTSLKPELARQGFRLEHWTHYQCLLMPLVWAVRRAPWRRGRRLERHPPGALGRVLGAVNGLEVRAFGRLRLPWGSSLVVLARKEGG